MESKAFLEKLNKAGYYIPKHSDFVDGFKYEVFSFKKGFTEFTYPETPKENKHPLDFWVISKHK